MTDKRIRVEDPQFYQPRQYNEMTERERVVARAYFLAGMEGGYPDIARGMAEEIIATDAYEAGRAYKASAGDGPNDNGR
jgi:hypothetical protein